MWWVAVVVGSTYLSVGQQVELGVPPRHPLQLDADVAALGPAHKAPQAAAGIRGGPPGQPPSAAAAGPWLLPPPHLPMTTFLFITG